MKVSGAFIPKRELSEVNDLPACGKPRPGSEWNKGWRELLVFDLRKGRSGKAYFLRERSEQEM